jgi:DNA-binding CsgD family transcriptional regulator
MKERGAPRRAVSARSIRLGASDQSMTRLSHRQWEALVDFVGAVAPADDVATLATGVVRDLPRIVAADIVTLNEIALRRGTVRAWAHPAEVVDVDRRRPQFVRIMGEHPVLQHFARTRDAGPRTISDFWTDRRFRSSALFNEYYRSLGTRFQMVARLPAADTVVGIALSRGRRDFSAADRLAIRLLQPYLAQAYRYADALAGARAALRMAGEAIDATRHAAAFVDDRGAVEFESEAARAWLDEFFETRRPASRLPAALASWLDEERATRRRRDRRLQPRRAYVTEMPRARLVVRAFVDPGRTLLLMSREPTAVDPEALRRLGLTDREAEVLRWVAEGKTNPEIARILDTRPRTVAKHMQRVLAKLGVETRTAAAVLARRAVDSLGE